MIPFALVSVLVVAFFAGAEIVLVSADRITLKRRLEEGAPGARYLRAMLGDPRRALSVTLAGAATFTVLASAFVTVRGDQWTRTGAIAAEILTTLVILVFAEVLPKTVGRARADSLFPVVARLVHWAGIVLWPVLAVATAGSNVLLTLLGVRREGRRVLLGRADLEVLLREAAVRPPAPHASPHFIGRVLDFGGTPVGDVLVPRTDLVAVEADATSAEALRVAAASRHTRLVVYRESVDAVMGVVHVFDLLAAGPHAPVGPLARPALVLPESVSSLDAFRRLAEAGQQIAIVADEFGGVAGIASLGDLLEELTGERAEEPRRTEAPVRPLGEHRWLVRGRTPVDELARIPGFVVPPGAYETLAGYLLARTGTIPAIGESVRLGPWRLTVADADRRRVLSVLVERVGTEAGGGDSLSEGPASEARNERGRTHYAGTDSGPSRSR